MAPTPVVVGVAGGSAAGKTTVVRRLLGRLDDVPVCLLEQDRYYRDRSDLDVAERSSLNYDHPDAVELNLLAAHVEALRRGLIVEVPRYDFTRHVRETAVDRTAASHTIVVEGILVLTHARLRDLLDVKVFVEADDDTRLSRRLERDVAERGRTEASVRTQYAATVLPMHRQFVEPSRQHADLVVPGTGPIDAEVEKLAAVVRRRLNRVNRS
jgi:uridine kinase